MSGEPIVIEDDPAGTLSGLVAAAGRLHDAGLPRFALIGGLAVITRLSPGHRITDDLDTVTDTVVPGAVEVIAAAGVGERADVAGRAIVSGVKVDLIVTAPVTDADLAGVTELDQRLFVAAHRWALDTAADTHIICADAVADLAVASPAALVAMKAGALINSGRDPNKRSPT